MQGCVLLFPLSLQRGVPWALQFQRQGHLCGVSGTKAGERRATPAPSPQSHKTGRAGASWEPLLLLLEILNISKPKCKQDFHKAQLYTILGQPGQAGDTRRWWHLLLRSSRLQKVSVLTQKVFLSILKSVVALKCRYLFTFLGLLCLCGLVGASPIIWPQWCQWGLEHNHKIRHIWRKLTEVTGDGAAFGF